MRILGGSHNGKDVGTGLNPLIILVKGSGDTMMMDSSGKNKQELSRALTKVSTAPHAVWGLNDEAMYFTGSFLFMIFKF